jgi:energy-coupling factor transport system permease protein
MDPRVKFALLLGYTAALFAVPGRHGMALLAAVGVLVLAASRLPAGVIAASLVPFYALALFAVLVNSLAFDPDALAGAYGIAAPQQSLLADAAPIPLVGSLYFLPAGLERSLFFCVRIFCMVVASLVLAYSTPATTLTAAIAWFLGPLRRLRVPVDDIASTFTLVLRFIPLAFEELQRLRTAQMARGASFGVGGLWRRMNAWAPVLVPWFVALYRQAMRMAVAMDVRCYGLGGARTSLTKLAFRAPDAFALLVGAACCVAAIML